MQAGWRIGSLFGIPFYIDSSWFIILCLVTLANGLRWIPELGVTIGWSVGFAMALLLFASVLLHELGHSLVAKSQGIKVNSITLFIFGGIASIEQESKTPGEAFQVAIAGPVVSFTLFALLGAIAQLLPELSPVSRLTEELSRINLVLAMFNLIPGLPLDGGQVLKAAVWKITGSRFKGVRSAAIVGKTLGILAIAFGLTIVFLADNYGGIWIALLGWFGLRNANAYDRLAYLQEALVQLVAADAMTRDFRIVDADITLRDFADDYLLNPTQKSVYFAASNGRYRGIVFPEDLSMVERSEWESRTVYSMVHPLAEITTVEENTLLIEVINRMEKHQLREITVLSRAGAVAGIIDRGDIVAALGQKLNVPIPREQIKQIKQEGSYPAGLQLDAIARATIPSVSATSSPKKR